MGIGYLYSCILQTVSGGWVRQCGVGHGRVTTVTDKWWRHVNESGSCDVTAHAVVGNDDGNSGDCKCTCNKVRRLERIATGHSCSTDIISGRKLGEPVRWFLSPWTCFHPGNPQVEFELLTTDSIHRFSRKWCIWYCGHPFCRHLPESAPQLLSPSVGTDNPRRRRTSGSRVVVLASVFPSTEADRPV